MQLIDSNALIAIEFLILSVVCAVLVRHYQAPMVTWDVSCTVYLSWVMGFAGVLLLPFDLSQSIALDVQFDPALVKVWKVTYWR
jgi:hypothetical protein